MVAMRLLSAGSMRDDCYLLDRQRMPNAAIRITSGADKAYPAVEANSGRTVVGYYTRDYAPVPTLLDAVELVGTGTDGGSLACP